MEQNPQEMLRDIRKRILANEPYTEDELRKAIAYLAGDRLTQLSTATKKKAKAPTVAVDLSDML